VKVIVRVYLLISVVEQALTQEIEASRLNDPMHIRQFAALDIAKFIDYHEEPGGFFYLTNSKNDDAIFTAEGYVEYVRLCPDMETYR
jgi:hypothetical protein